MRRANLAAAFAAALVVFAILVALGVWQLRRLAWKEALIAEVEARAHASPIPLPPPDAWAGLRPADYEYRRVEADGVYDYDQQELLFRSLETPRGPYAGVGYFVLTPLRLASGESVIVNRGFVPDTMKAQAQNGPRGQTHVVGLMRASEPRNWFTPADQPADRLFFSQDVEALAAAMRLGPHAPFAIDAEASAGAGADPLPEAGETRLSFPNNHLSYAFTWFGLAIALIGVMGAYVFKAARGRAT